MQAWKETGALQISLSANAMKFKTLPRDFVPPARQHHLYVHTHTHMYIHITNFMHRHTAHAQGEGS